MKFGKDTQLLTAVAELKDADYSKNPKIGDIYKRLLRGRKQFENVMNKDIQAIMQISSLDLTLNYVTDEMHQISESIAEGTQIIHASAEECSSVAGQVNEQHEELTNTIIRAAEDTDEVYKKIVQSEDNSLTEDEIQQRFEQLEYLKIHPRDQEENKLLLARGERMYEEATGDLRKEIDHYIGEFEQVLNKQNKNEIEQARKELKRALDEIEELLEGEEF